MNCRERVSAAKLRKWHRQALALDERARRLMDEMSGILGFEGEATDQIDNVLCGTEDLVLVLSRPDLDQWRLVSARTPPKALDAMVDVILAKAL